jgi:hypothetical protein
LYQFFKIPAQDIDSRVLVLLRQNNDRHVGPALYRTECQIGMYKDWLSISALISFELPLEIFKCLLNLMFYEWDLTVLTILKRIDGQVFFLINYYADK